MNLMYDQLKTPKDNIAYTHSPIDSKFCLPLIAIGLKMITGKHDALLSKVIYNLCS